MALTPRNTGKTTGTLDAMQARGLIPAEAPRTVIGLETVLGADDRQEIIQTDNAPWRMICSLSLRSGTGARYVGTGWLVGPRTVITAGHCIVDQSAGQIANIEVMAGRRGDDMPFGSVAVTNAETEVHPRWASHFDPDTPEWHVGVAVTNAETEVHPRWASHFDPDYDIGVIKLPEPLGEQTGWFAYAVAGDDDLMSHQMNVGGYPAVVQDRLAGGEELWWHKDAVLDATDRRLFYATDTSGGQSGSPVWAYEDDEGDPIVVGIHAYGATLIHSDVTGGSAQANSAPRIDADIADLIDRWLAEADGA